MFAFVAVRFGVVMYLEVRFKADSLEAADKFVNTPLAAGEKNVGGEIAFFIRDGVHFFSREDWAFYIECLSNH